MGRLLLFFSLLCLGLYQKSISSNVNQSQIIKKDIEVKRIVALTSLSADLVSSISNESLVGIPGSSLFKDNDDFNNKVIVSSGRNPPNLEKIIKLKPELVIGSTGFHDKTLKTLNKLGIKTISTRIENFSDLDELSFDIHDLLDKKVKLDLASLMPNCYNQDDNHKINKNKEVLVLVSSKPILSPNSKSWAGNMINRFGYINLTSELDSKSQFKGYVNLSPEWVVSSKPSNLIIINTPGSNDSQYRQMSIWNSLPAVINNKVFSFDYYGLINAGSLNSINKACEKLSSI